MIRILCFGDSNTFGYKPDGSGRFGEEIRWTGRIQKKLGDNYKIIEEGLCGRMTIFEDDLRRGRRGSELVGTLVESHNPIDVLASEYEKLAKEKFYYYLDASKYAKPSPVDREHLDAEGHEKLAEAVYDKLVEILGI